MNAILLSGLDGSAKGGPSTLLDAKTTQSTSSFAQLLGQETAQIDAALEQPLTALGLDAHAVMDALRAAGLNPNALFHTWHTTSATGSDLKAFLKDQGLDVAALRKPIAAGLALDSDQLGRHENELAAATSPDALAFIQNTLFIAQESFHLRTGAGAAQGASNALSPAMLAKLNHKAGVIAQHNEAKHGVTTGLDSEKHSLKGMAFSGRLSTEAEPFIALNSQDLTRSPSLQTGAEFHLQLANSNHKSAASQIAFNAAPTYSAHIATPLTHSQWSQDLGRVMVTLTQQAQHTGPQNAEIRLDPPELGPMRIVLSITDNIANATIFAAHAQTRLTLEHALPQLQQQLAQSGLSLGEANVSDHGFGGQAHQDSSSANQTAAQPFSLSNGTGHSDSALLSEPHDATHRRTPDAIIDTFA